jgi:branched-chain amino acid aminotransferase
MTTLYTFVNDEFVPADQAALRVPDLSIQRGYGIFDFFKTLGGRPIFLDDHLDRFFHSAAQLRLLVGKSRDELTAIITTLQQKNNLPDSGIRMTLTGGYSTDGFNVAKPNLVITQRVVDMALSKDCRETLRLITYPHQRQMPEIKTIDYLMAIWLEPHIRDNGAADVLYHHNGNVTECPRSNFFIVTADDALATPGKNVLKGITRLKLLDIVRSQITVEGRSIRLEERDVKLEELLTAKEAFITNTTKLIVPVTHIDNSPIGKGTSYEGAIGPVAQSLNRQLYAINMSDAARSSDAARP